jgi:uncharacterized protein with beta-barrel porin domain
MRIAKQAGSGPVNRISPAGRGLRSVARQSLAVLLAPTALGVVSAHAVDGTWIGAGDEWTDPSNWSSNPSVPDGTATFTVNTPTAVQSNGIVSIGSVNFTQTPNAAAYTITTNDLVVVNGTGVFNNSTNTQTFVTAATTLFQGSSTASGGSKTVSYFNVGALVFQNSSTGGTATITNNSSLEFDNTSTAGSAKITNNVVADFFDTSSAGTSQITNAAAATLSFHDNTTAGASTITNSGAVAFLNSSSAGSASLSTTSGSFATITFSNTSTAGNANIALVDGTLTFLNASTAANATITNNSGGTTTLGVLGGTDTSNAGTSHITNNSSGTTNFLAHTSAMNATIANNSGGNTTFQDQSTAANATIVNNSGGMTTLGVIAGTDTASAGNAVIINNSGGTTAFFAATTAGSSTIINSLGGSVQLGASGGANDTATAGSSTIDNSGAVSFNSKTTAGIATITTHSGGNVFFFDTSSGGGARFVTDAGGTVNISALTSAGTTAGSIEGAGSYVLGAKNLAVGSNNLSTTVSGIISGIGGSLTKVGTGTLTLTNTETYTGATTVSAGKLVVDGSTAASTLTTVNPTGTLAGSGTVGNTAIAGGTLAPGSAGGSIFGPLTVNGSLSFTTASTYMIQVSPANAGLTNVTGAATLGGATVNVAFQAGTYVNRQYTILHATGGVSGNFNPAVTSNMANIQSTLAYDPNNVFLNINLSFVPPPGVVLNVNQQNVANALTGFFNSTGGIPVAFAGLNAAGLTVASGELGTGVIQSSIKADDLFLNLLLDPTIAGRAGGFAQGGSASSQFAADDEALAFAKRRASPSERDAYAMATKAPLLATQPVNRWSVWGAAYGGSETVGGSAAIGSQDLTARVWGVAAGADYKVSPNTLLGFALAGGGTGFSLANGLGSGSSDLFQAGVYGRTNVGPAYLSAALAYGWHDVTTNRTVALAGVDQLQGRFRAETFSGRFEGGYRFATPFVGITPYAAAQVISFNLPNYAERSLVGGGLFALNYAAQTTTDTRTELGVRTDKSFAMQDAVLTLRGRAAWAHDYNPDRAVTGIFQALPGAAFVVNGARPNADSALVSAGAEMKWLSGFSLAATFEGEFSGNVTSYAGKGVAKYSW